MFLVVQPMHLHQHTCAALAQICQHGFCQHSSEGGMIQLETLIELKFINLSCSSLYSY